MMTSASHSSLERWAILHEIWGYWYRLHNRERILQVKIIFKEKINLEIAGHFGEVNNF